MLFGEESDIIKRNKKCVASAYLFEDFSLPVLS